MNKEEFQTIAKKLIEKGEDAEEMQYWVDIHDDLPEKQQKEIFENFTEELKKLEVFK
ncbi:MAG TPA: hypothetical protein P5323_01505 [Candidatus Moranbacteria bacterium]|nr:hypothetical protein [Candidatus Moranbacteria bacterium]HRY27790.1 hypothetical protein [Candidatus Moranbacteria bacterium]HSA08131.1 hypothetical protein [Candidatus Moranbacteria bacterium]